MDFWSLIGANQLSDRAGVEAALAELRAKLLSLSGLALIQFEDRMSEYLYRLDRREFAEIAVSLEGKQYPQTEDGFLYARCAVVLSGLETYEQVLKGDTSFEAFVDPRKGAEGLLSLPAAGYESVTGREFTYSSEFDLEWGSNPAGWPEG